MKNELNKFNKRIVKNNENFYNFYQRSHLPYDVAKDHWIHRQEKSDKNLKIALFFMIIIFIIAFVLATLILWR